MSAFQCSILTFAESQLEEVERPKSFRFFKLGAKTTQQLNYMMEAFDRQVVEPEGEGVGWERAAGRRGHAGRCQKILSQLQAASELYLLSELPVPRKEEYGRWR